MDLAAWRHESIQCFMQESTKKNQKDQENVVLLIRDPSGFIFEPTL